MRACPHYLSTRLRADRGGPIRLLAVAGGPRRCRAYVSGWAVWQLPRGLRWYVLAVIGAAVAAAGTAAALTSWRARDAWLFAALAGFGAVSAELTRRGGEPAAAVKNVHGIWLL